MEPSQKFRKSERLCSKKDIQSIFDHGHSFGIYPFRVVWLDSKYESDYPARIVITIPKKRFKRAVMRNLLRRRVRESYRKRKSTFYEQLNDMNRTVNFVVIFTGENVMSFKDIDHKISLLISRFPKEIMNTR